MIQSVDLSSRWKLLCYLIDPVGIERNMPLDLHNSRKRILDVGMVQRGLSLGLALKARERLRVSGNFGWQELEGDEAVQTRVFGPVHHAHAADTKFLDDPVVRDGLVDH
jgi:hypothetical protein